MARHLDIAKFKKLLEDERARIEDEIRGTDAGGGESTQGMEQAELSRYDEHQGDVGTEMFLQERDVALEANAEAMLRQVEIALQRIDDGTYGTCDRCGKPIAAARLEAIPYTAFCIECAARFEGQS
jgi:RNA polymerase-binding transcription factor DksA